MLIRAKSAEIKGLYDAIVAEQQRSMELNLQPGAMVGFEKEERIATRWARSLRLRHPWLLLNLLTAFGAAAVVGVFQRTMHRLLILTVFLPILADQAGNTGGQALAITLRGLALGDLRSGAAHALIRKEAMLGLLNGAIIGLVAGLAMVAFASLQHLASAPTLGVVVFLAMVGSCLVSGLSGAVVPLVLKPFGADPATASTIFLTTATNVVSVGMLLALAALVVFRNARSSRGFPPGATSAARALGPDSHSRASVMCAHHQCAAIFERRAASLEGG